MGGLTGVLLATYGSPTGPDDVGRYLGHILGREPTDDQVADLRARYDAVGGVSALREATERQADLLQEALDDLGDYLVTAGYRHGPPFLEDVAEDLARNVDRGVVVPLAPHFNTMSVEGYLQAAREGIARVEAGGAEGAAGGADVAPPFSYVRSYHEQPRLIEAWADRVQRALDDLAGRTDDPCVVFTAHSLPASVLDHEDPYPHQVLRTCELVAAKAGVDEAAWRRAYQSAPPHGPWLGPDVLDALGDVAKEGFIGVAVAPVGFVSDHLETRYDLDIEAKERAEELDLAFERVPAPNDDPAFVRCLVEVVQAALRADRG